MQVYLQNGCDITSKQKDSEHDGCSESVDFDELDSTPTLRKKKDISMSDGRRICGDEVDGTAVLRKNNLVRGISSQNSIKYIYSTVCVCEGTCCCCLADKPYRESSIVSRYVYFFLLIIQTTLSYS